MVEKQIYLSYLFNHNDQQRKPSIRRLIMKNTPLIGMCDQQHLVRLVTKQYNYVIYVIDHHQCSVTTVEDKN